MTSLFNSFIDLTLRWPEKVAAYLQWLAPLVARLIVGEVFMTAGWGKLQNLDAMIQNFTSWGIPFPQILTPFTSGAEFVCGILLMLGLFTRISAGILGVIMIVAIKSVLWADVDSLDTLLGFSETAYLAIFLWLSIAGAGKISIDHWLTRK
ncbi:DoxX family protein [Cellvibrio sp.]|uniref:DoxX family protein n=1 Tax=Cellvibrio sp. TaxID=1965322 RepID=UPI0039648880